MYVVSRGYPVNQIELIISVDGIPLFKDRTNHAYPILIKACAKTSAEYKIFCGGPWSVYIIYDISKYNKWNTTSQVNLLLTKIIEDLKTLTTTGISVNGNIDTV